jgi:hypothetical protein
MDRDTLTKLVVERAIRTLKYDDANPDVGMVMFITTAVKLAEESVFEEAARWNSLTALTLDFEDIREDVIKIVGKRR